MTEYTNNEENSEVVQTKKMGDAPLSQPEIFELKCESCGIIGELEEYMDEFDCPQCGGKMYPLEKNKKDMTETTRLSNEEVPEVETATISISKAQINEYKQNIKVAKPVDIGIFSSGVPSMSSTKGMSTSSKSLGASAPAAPIRTSVPAKPSTGGFPPITRSIPQTATATKIMPDPILEKELESLRKRKEQQEEARKSRTPEPETTKTLVDFEAQIPSDTAIAQKLEIERLRAEGLEKMLQQETFAAEQEMERLKKEQEAHQQQVLEAQEAFRREREELDRKRIELEELERRFQASSQTVQDTYIPDEEQEQPQAVQPHTQVAAATSGLDNKKLIIIVSAILIFMLLFGIIVFMLGKSSAKKASSSENSIIPKISCFDGQWRGRQMSS